MSVHILVIGPSTCGKSALSKAAARDARAAGIPVLVCDPVCDPAWREFADWVTDDPDAMLKKAKASRRCLIILDEAGDYLNGSAKARPYLWFARRSRHRGHKCIFIAQEYTAIWPTFRTNSRTLYQFCTPLEEAQKAARGFIDKGLLLAANEKVVPQYHYLEKTRFRPLAHGVTEKMPTGRKRRKRAPLAD